ncbi:MAG TPA: TIM-barrel domain-containing protein [Naasia sp.]
MSSRYGTDWAPVADPRAVVQGDRHRITVLTEALIRIEWSETGCFEDRASTFAVHRRHEVPEFRVQERAGHLHLQTTRLELSYDGGPFDPAGLSVQVRGGVTNYHSVWRFGEEPETEGGTARTLDNADGAAELGAGVVSRNGIAVLDDSDSFVFGEDGMPASRLPGTRDLYVFAHGHDYAGAVRDLFRVSGKPPLLPRWALGNWWSRYHAYSAEGYLGLLDEFDRRGLPFSVGVIDMDWHVTDVDPRHGSGWTGYTWNRDLFPDPAEFLRKLHERGLRVTLNVHPADGIRPYEDAYPAVAAALGLDEDEPAPFDLTDPAFVDAYFDLVHRPLEEQGVDFWWLDWQQGGHSRLPGVDPLWLLNHFHFLDSAQGGRRPLTFSRYAGPGSQRYPVGFSGDAVISWESLDFQPYFTATASNIGYGWWSHDIGGHLFGRKDDALAARWVQFGAFSPINRLHSSSDSFIRKEPWTFGPEAEASMVRFLRLRHRLVPYLHTMNARSALEGEPLVRPVYWDHPEAPEAYRVPNQYAFGTELLVAPITTPQDPVLLLGSARAWLPRGRWTDILTGVVYAGGREVRLHRGLDGMPVLLRAGGILPLDAAALPGNGTAQPDALELLVAPGADGSFVLEEESGEGDGRDPGVWARTRISWSEADRTLTIGAADGATDALPEARSWRVTLLGATADSVAAADGDDLRAVAAEAGASFELPAAPPGVARTLEVRSLEPAGWSGIVQRVFELLERAQTTFAAKEDAHRAVAGASSAAEAAARLEGLELEPGLRGALLELVLSDPSATARPSGGSAAE